MARFFIIIAATSGFLSVALGAMGAHVFQHDESELLDNFFTTALDYHFIHTLALLVVGGLLLPGNRSRWLCAAGISFMFGLVFFCGSLYLMALSNISFIGPVKVSSITPFGGMCFLGGWFFLGTGYLIKGIGQNNGLDPND